MATNTSQNAVQKVPPTSCYWAHDLVLDRYVINICLIEKKKKKPMNWLQEPMVVALTQALRLGPWGHAWG